MAAVGGSFESARSIEERKEQTRIARAEVLRQVLPFGGFWRHLESRAEAFWEPDLWLSCLPNTLPFTPLYLTSGCVEVVVSLWKFLQTRVSSASWVLQKHVPFVHVCFLRKTCFFSISLSFKSFILDIFNTWLPDLVTSLGLHHL